TDPNTRNTGPDPDPTPADSGPSPAGEPSPVSTPGPQISPRDERGSEQPEVTNPQAEQAKVSRSRIGSILRKPALEALKELFGRKSAPQASEGRAEPRPEPEDDMAFLRRMAAGAPKEDENPMAAIRRMAAEQEAAERPLSPTTEAPQDSESISAIFPDMPEKGIDAYEYYLGREESFAIEPLGMVMELIVNHREKRGNSILRNMGFNQKNLENILYAVFSEFKGKPLSFADFEMLCRSSRDPADIFFHNLFGFNEETSAKTIVEEFNRLTAIMVRFPKLLAFDILDVADALAYWKENPTTTLDDIRREFPGLPLDRAGTDSPLEFGKGVLDDMPKPPTAGEPPAQPPRTRTAVVEVTEEDAAEPLYTPRPTARRVGRIPQRAPERPVDFERLRGYPILAEAKQFFEGLLRIFQIPNDAYRDKDAAKINGKDRWDIPEEIDTKFGRLLGTAFQNAIISEKDAFEIIAEKFGLANNEDRLIEKILEIHAALSAEYPNVSPAPTPAAPVAPAAPAAPSAPPTGPAPVAPAQPAAPTPSAPSAAPRSRADFSALAGMFGKKEEE
ncbi:hypothetical protein KJ742_06640, partial [Patescibacteria group bacterium]|nr:hypothetical protein [Patescibacteria group bacterium]MBU1683590.1 hypothetical protein [Patescibacteria group bacterium]